MTESTATAPSGARRTILTIVATLAVIGLGVGIWALVQSRGDDDSVRCDTRTAQILAEQEGKECTSTPPPTTINPIDEGQVDDLRAMFRETPMSTFCPLFIEQYAQRYGSDSVAARAFITDYERNNGLDLRRQAEDYIRSVLDDCIRDYG